MRAKILFDNPETLTSLADLPPTKDSLDRYKEDLASLPLLSAEEALELARHARSGDGEALDRLVCGNLRFVISVAKKYQNRGLPLEDLISEGNLGLLKAARKFDPDRGWKFISYAVYWIRQAIQKALADQGHCVRIPVNRAGESRRLLMAGARLRRELDRSASPEELAGETGLSLSVISALGVANRPPKRLGQDPEEGQGVFDIADKGADTDQKVLEAARAAAVERALDGLSRREAKVVRLYYGFDGEEQTLEEIGTRLGITRERVRQLRNRALGKLGSNAELAQEAGRPIVAPTPRRRKKSKRQLRAA